jgi:SAM-dependent methyltransferase
MPKASLPREDLAARRGEAFRPPPHERASGRASRLKLALRRFADLQFGSTWRDLALLLPAVQGTLADVGCGAQPYRELLPSEVFYIGVDVEDSERQFGYRASGTRYYQGSVLPLDDGEADAVLCTETLEHVVEIAPFLKELARAVKPGGVLILTVPFAARWHFVPYDYWRFTPSALRLLLEEGGFGGVKVYARGGALAVAGYKVLGLVLVLLAGYGKQGPVSLLARCIGVGALPLALLAALLANLGIVYPGSAEDTLGYTVLAQKSRESA